MTQQRKPAIAKTGQKAQFAADDGPSLQEANADHYEYHSLNGTERMEVASSCILAGLLLGGPGIALIALALTMINELVGTVANVVGNANLGSGAPKQSWMNKESPRNQVEQEMTTSPSLR